MAFSDGSLRNPFLVGLATEVVQQVTQLQTQKGRQYLLQVKCRPCFVHSPTQENLFAVSLLDLLLAVVRVILQGNQEAWRIRIRN